jgi:hypothetical protein
LFQAVVCVNVRRIFAGIAQLVEQLICNQQVVGSNPTAGSTSVRMKRILIFFLASTPLCFAQAYDEKGLREISFFPVPRSDTLTI